MEALVWDTTAAYNPIPKCRAQDITARCAEKLMGYDMSWASR